MKFTFLGTGNAANVPAYGCSCKACDRAVNDVLFRRNSACAFVETEHTKFLLDAGLAELGQRFPAGSYEYIVLTHYHMDHVHGLFPIRWGKTSSIKVIGPDDPNGCDDLLKHSGILDFSQKSHAFKSFYLSDVKLTPVPLQHSKPTLGYVIEQAGKRFAYLTDTVGLPKDTKAFLIEQKLDAMAIDCSHPPRDAPPKGHNDLTTALITIDQVKPKQTYLTHISHELDAWFIDNPNSLPDNVFKARDKQTLKL
jgi:phosphoribosyl 1,2-cyclic phosphate phosphodiesterase